MLKWYKKLQSLFFLPFPRIMSRFYILAGLEKHLSKVLIQKLDSFQMKYTESNSKSFGDKNAINKKKSDLSL